MGIGGGRRVIFGKMVVIKNSFFPPLFYILLFPLIWARNVTDGEKKEYIFTFRSGNSAYGHYCLGIKYRWKKRGGWDDFFLLGGDGSTFLCQMGG